MNTSALLLMMTVQVMDIAITAYFYYRVMSAKPKPEPDSYTENDDRPR